MGAKTEIAWCDSTWNCVRGCSRVSEGCRRCYAERMAARGLPGLNSPTTGEPFALMTPAGPRWTGRVELIESALELPLRWRKPRRIFVNSMSDLFHESLPDEAIDRVFAVMQHAQARGHIFQVLTKRAERMARYFAAPDLYERWIGAVNVIRGRWSGLPMRGLSNPANMPLLNVWLGVSVEDQVTADERIPLLLQTPAAVRFVSVEPMLAPMDLYSYLPTLEIERESGMWRDLIRWVIVGGESGPGARPMHPDWARALHDQCVAARVPFFMKQICDARGRKLPFDSLPEDLKIREFPA